MSTKPAKQNHLPMISFPNARISLGLHVTGKRNDGYHNIESLMLPVSMHDSLEFVVSPDGITRFTAGGHPLPASVRPNLCMQAHELLNESLKKHKFPEAKEAPKGFPPLHIHLHKAIPAGSGLAGGSANAAFMLKMLNSAFDLKLTKKQLAKLAATLGSDCPFFIHNKPMLATGRGNIFKSISAKQFEKFNIIIVVPPIHISTEKAYQEIEPKTPKYALSEIIEAPLNECLSKLTNDFEKVVFRKYPQIKTIKTNLLANGAEYASLSGSGSAIYGLYKGTPPIQIIKQQFDDCMVHVAHLLI